MVKRYVRKSIRRPRRGNVRPRRRLGVSFVTPGTASALGQQYGFRATSGLKRTRAGAIGRRANSGRIARRRFGPPPPPPRQQARTLNVGPPLQYRKEAVGRMRMFSMKMFEKMSLNTIYMRAQGLNRLGSVTGTLCPGFLPIESKPLGAGLDSVVPLHIVELTNINQTTVGFGSRPCVYYTTVSDAGAVSFVPIALQNAAGTVTANQGWTFEASDLANSGAQSGVRYVRHCWFDIRLLLHGCTVEPTTFDVVLFTIKNDYHYVDPAFLVAGSSTTIDNSRRNAFWQSWVRGTLVSPILPGHAEATEGIKIIRRYREVFAPEHNTDRNDEPDAKSLKIFLRDGKVYDYDQGGSAAANDSDLFGLGWKQEDQSTGQYANIPKQSQRIYMMIRALNTTQQGAAPARTNTPSYDIVMRRKSQVVAP